MRADRNLILFLKNTEWYTFVVGKGYVPTEKAPPKAVQAMEAYNSYTYNKKQQAINQDVNFEVYKKEVK